MVYFAQKLITLFFTGCHLAHLIVAIRINPIIQNMSNKIYYIYRLFKSVVLQSLLLVNFRLLCLLLKLPAITWRAFGKELPRAILSLWGYSLMAHTILLKEWCTLSLSPSKIRSGALSRWVVLSDIVVGPARILPLYSLCIVKAYEKGLSEGYSKPPPLYSFLWKDQV